MTSDILADLARRINSAETPKAVAYVAGGGTEVFPLLLGRGGGSATLLSARIPYGPDDFRAVLGHDPGPFVDARAARSLAMAAFRHALTIRGELQPEEVFGLGATSKLVRASGEREGRAHEIHAAIQTSSTTLVQSVTLPGGSDRPWQERINALLLLRLLAAGKGVDGTVPLEHEGRSVEPGATSEQSADRHDCGCPALPELLGGRRAWVALDLAGGPADLGLEAPRLLLPGSFRPLHAGHVAMADAATRLTGLDCAFEISLFHPEKPPLDYIAIRSRLKGFEGQARRLYLTNAPTYIEKARLFPGCTFVVGHDTAQRIVDPRFYGGPAARDAMLAELESLAARFLVFGRVDESGQFRDFSPEEFDHPVSGFLARVATPIPGHVFRVDISSTEIRARSADDFH